MGLITVLSSTSVGYYNKVIARQVGLNEAILLSELCSKHDFWESKNELTEDGYFYETMEDIEDNTCLTPYQQRKALEKLNELGIIETKLKGLPAVKYYKISENKLLSLLITRCEETSQLDVKKLNLSNKDNNKEDNILVDTIVSKEISEPITDISKEIPEHPTKHTQETGKSDSKKKLEKIVSEMTPKKKNRFDQCVDKINEYMDIEKLPDEQGLLELLEQYLTFRISVKDNGKTLYLGNWIALLNKLAELPGDKQAIVKQSLENCWLSFYEVHSDKRGFKTNSNDTMNTTGKSVQRTDFDYSTENKF